MKRLFPLLVLVSLIFTGCATTYLQQSTNVSTQQKKYDKILVVHRETDKTVRIALENQIVNDLKAKGVNAASSIQAIKTVSFDKELTEAQLDQLVDTLLQQGYTGVIVTNLLDASQYTQVTPGATYPAYYGGWNTYWDYYPMYQRQPDRVTTGVEYILESCLFDITDTQGDNLQWVGRFKLRDPSDLQKVTAKYSAELIEALMASSISN